MSRRSWSSVWPFRSDEDFVEKRFVRVVIRFRLVLGAETLQQRVPLQLGDDVAPELVFGLAVQIGRRLCRKTVCSRRNTLSPCPRGRNAAAARSIATWRRCRAGVGLRFGRSDRKKTLSKNGLFAS